MPHSPFTDPCGPRPWWQAGKPYFAALLMVAVLAQSPAVGESQNSFAYEPPERPPKGPVNHYAASPADWLLDHMATHLKELGLTVLPREPSSRTLIARYNGDPREFVDCGTVQMLIDGKRTKPPRQYSANRPETRTHRTAQGMRVGLLREMQLDAQIAVEAQPDGKGTRVRSEVIYVLTKTVSRVYKGGEPGAVLDREVMSFTSGEIGRFKKGTSCVATGKLEELAVLPFKTAS